MLVLQAIVAVFRAIFTTKAELIVENLALRQQLNVLRRKTGRPRLRKCDRVFWLWLARSWTGWRNRIIVVTPETVIRWHRQDFKYYWTWKSRRKGGRPAVAREVRDLIRRMSAPIPSRERPAYTVNCSNSASISPSPPSPSTWFVIGSHRALPGGPSSITTSRTSFPSTSSRCQQSGFASCLSLWLSPMNEGASCISTSPLIRQLHGRDSNSVRLSPGTRPPAT